MPGWRIRSAIWFNGNRRAALEEIIARASRAAPPPKIYLSTAHVPYLDAYWRLYLVKHHRGDLLHYTAYFDAESLDLRTIPQRSLMLASTKERRTLNTEAAKSAKESSRCDRIHVQRHRDTETTIVRPGPQSGPRNGTSRENAKQQPDRLCVFAARSVSQRGRLRRPPVARSAPLRPLRASR
jgi:hypothetical protein